MVSRDASIQRLKEQIYPFIHRLRQDSLKQEIDWIDERLANPGLSSEVEALLWTLRVVDKKMLTALEQEEHP